MQYTIKYKKPRSWFWKSETVRGHQFDELQNKLVLYYEDGSVREIAHWKDYEVKLGVEWVLAIKQSMEKETGTSIPVNIGG